MSRFIGAGAKLSRWTVDRIEADGSRVRSALRFEPDTQEAAQHYIETILAGAFPGVKFETRYRTFGRRSNNQNERTT